MNKVILTGRLTADPDIRYTTGEKNTAIATFTLAVNRRFVKRDDPNAQTADFIRCQAFGKQAEFMEKYFRKGQKADITGRIQTGKYTNKDGQTVYTTDVYVEEVEFGESKNASSGTDNNSHSKEWSRVSQDLDVNVPDNVDEELPFS